MTLFHGLHLTVFKDSMRESLSPDDLGGKPWLTFCRKLEGTGVDANSFVPADEKGKICRSEVFNLSSNDDISTPTVCAAILAWGGMYMTYHEDLFRKNTEWLGIAENIRKATINRAQAYEKLRTQRLEGSLKGLGPAFFTKLIYFLTKRDHYGVKQGYIMDQWASCSINLLVGKPVVHLNCQMSPQKDAKPLSYNFTVSDLNTEAHYEEFCVAMDALVALDPAYSPDMIDRAILGVGKNTKQVPNWRDYVTRHRVP
tara:strand:- start:2760 stop:3527 length:768 start_codon:yes stop_codon:yes gene_type:complete